MKMLYIKLFIEREKNTGQSAPECPFKFLSFFDSAAAVVLRRVDLSICLSVTQNSQIYFKFRPQCSSSRGVYARCASHRRFLVFLKCDQLDFISKSVSYILSPVKIMLQ